MQINKINSTNFQSRNKTIRFADDIARRVNQCYPRISSTLVGDFNNIDKFEMLYYKLIKKVSKGMRKEKDTIFEDADSVISQIRAFIEPIKKFKVGNCGESAQLASIVANVNGIKDCHIVKLYDKEGKDLDHMILFVNDTKPYIIDAWLGFADFIQNALEKYKGIYRQHFEFNKSDDIVLATNYNDAFVDFLRSDFSRGQINKIKKMYPEQIIRRGYV